ncbi:hypothetical protein [Burkholderia pseudomallei]|uniref:hypothetical protein n=1 Tax=Burkholderia pseudomallei TaxID=28450 RepID=UPI001CC2A23B|nr:hypothetical protein [Burkholderia pseudomallei]
MYENSYHILLDTPRTISQPRFSVATLNCAIDPHLTTTMNLWAVNPVWQNFSSLYREAVTAREAKTGMERSHHLTASLYFGIAALEAFLNEKMRAHMNATHSEEEIFNKLRKGQILAKIKKWPTELLGKSLLLGPATLDLITNINDIRGDLTHPKTSGHDIYAKLETINPDAVVAAVSEYVVKYHEAAGTRYPYWIFGWNYLNPSPNVHEIYIINDQQFCFSLQAIGFPVPAAAHWEAEAWRDQYLKTFEGYEAIRDALAKLECCEPKFNRFPFKPILCRRWWTSEHHRSCGHVTGEALDFARNYGL